jgi:hypothetical protein
MYQQEQQQQQQKHRENAGKISQKLSSLMSKLKT